MFIYILIFTLIETLIIVETLIYKFLDLRGLSSPPGLKKQLKTLKVCPRSSENSKLQLNQVRSDDDRCGRPPGHRRQLFPRPPAGLFHRRLPLPSSLPLCLGEGHVAEVRSAIWTAVWICPTATLPNSDAFVVIFADPAGLR